VDGTLAAFVQPSRGMTGQDRLDLPWTLVVGSAKAVKPVLGNIGDVGVLTWTDDGICCSAVPSPASTAFTLSKATARAFSASATTWRIFHCHPMARPSSV
jgi:hypothetical protein